MSKSIRDLEEALKDVKYEARLDGLRKEGNWEHFKFRCLIEGEEFTFKVGIGHAKWFKGSTVNTKAREEGYLIVLENQYDKGLLRLKRVKISELVYCILSDYTDETFDDWCSNFGYDTDSRKALETYLECQNNWVRLRKALGSKFSEIREIFLEVDDY